MKVAMRILEGLRRLNRGYKLALVLLAAWSPMAFARSPWLAIGVMACCTGAFFLSTRTPASLGEIPSAIETTPTGGDDVQS